MLSGHKNNYGVLPGKFTKLFITARDLTTDRILRMKIYSLVLKRIDKEFFNLFSKLFFDEIESWFVHRRLRKQHCLAGHVDFVYFLQRFNHNGFTFGLTHKPDDFSVILFAKNNN